MSKLEKEFPQYSFHDLQEGVQKTLKALEAAGWSLKCQDEQKGHASWRLHVGNRLLPWNLLDLLLGAYRDVLTIEVSGKRVSAAIAQKTFVVDWQGGREEILQEFFSHLDSMLSSGTLNRQVLKRRPTIGERFVIYVAVVALIIALLAVIM